MCRRAARRPTAHYEHGRGLLATLLDIGLHEVFRVGLQDVIYLVQQVVEFGLDLLALLRGSGRLFYDVLLLTRRGGLLLQLSLRHSACTSCSGHCPSRSTNSAVLEHSAINLPT